MKGFFCFVFWFFLTLFALLYQNKLLGIFSFVLIFFSLYLFRQNWRQLDQDMWRMEKWLESARANLRSHTSVPTDMEQLEDAIQVGKIISLLSFFFLEWQFLLPNSGRASNFHGIFFGTYDRVQDIIFGTYDRVQHLIEHTISSFPSPGSPRVPARARQPQVADDVGERDRVPPVRALP